MKRSGQVGLVLMTALGLASCSRSKPQPQQPVAVIDSLGPATPPSQATMTWDNKPRDPCAQQYFDEHLCQTAVHNHGYHYGGAWIPFVYTLPYISYYSNHRTFLSGGGTYVPTPVEVYHSGFKAPAAGTVVRGGFGSTASSMRASSGSSSSSSGGSHPTASPSSSSSGSHASSSPSSSSGSHASSPSSSSGSHSGSSSSGS